LVYRLTVRLACRGVADRAHAWPPTSQADSARPVRPRHPARRPSAF
jgi:hypothetical protein